ncbi:MAG: NAD(P)/FAD-dependent oxidoreductase [Proteobacteria bacterium]|nr:NAD(P)/FAD-dependent oxidoreductase [Pseudomonadota bacterium]
MTTDKHFHTIIIGAGPGGLACASLLAQKGIDVLVLERSRRIGPKVCAGGITWSGLARHLPAELIEKPFSSQHIRTGRQQTVISSPEPIISTINRENLGQWMAEKASRSGSTIKTGTYVTAIGAKEVITSSARFTYDFLVGADGSNSLVRRYLQIPVVHMGAGVQYLVPGNFAEMVWHLDPDQFATGYAWIFPHKNCASVGAYANRADMSPKVLQEKLHHWMAKHGMNTTGLKAEAATINFDFRGFHFGNRFLVGDAAGLASGLTGEGIYSAVCSGEAVARTIIDPAHKDQKLARLIKKHRQHSRLLRLCGTNRQFAKIILESLVAALRTKIIHFSALEMGE